MPGDAPAIDVAAGTATVLGNANPELSAGADALVKGRVSEGIRLTLAGLERTVSAWDRAVAHSNLCAGYAMQMRWIEALPHCNLGIAIDAGNWRAYNNRAAALTGLGLYELALADVHTAIGIAPDMALLQESLRIVENNQRIQSDRRRRPLRT